MDVIGISAYIFMESLISWFVYSFVLIDYSEYLVWKHQPSYTAIDNFCDFMGKSLYIFGNQRDWLKRVKHQKRYNPVGLISKLLFLLLLFGFPNLYGFIQAIQEKDYSTLIVCGLMTGIVFGGLYITLKMARKLLFFNSKNT